MAKSFKREYFDPGIFNRHLFVDCFDKISARRFLTNSRPGRVTKLPEAAFYVGMILRNTWIPRRKQREQEE